MTELVVELYGQRIGTLTERSQTFDFQADSDAIARYGVGSRILSFAVPLSQRPRPSEAPRRRNFFDEILPEGRARTRLAGNALLAPDYTIGMLARYGRDVAGAVKIWDPTAPGEPRSPSVIPIDAVRVREMLAEVARAPLGNATVRRMSSLAGVQDKIVLARLGDAWAEPLDGYPSTHIIKPVVAGYPSLIFDEEYGSRIARQLGLASFDTHVEVFDGISALVIERYDRTSDPAGGRIHQEDFNQVLGMSGEGKYEASGHPGLRAIADVLRHVDRRTLEQFLRMVTMSLATGNLDFHAKNISILHHPDGRIELAPAYDVVPQVHLGFDEDVALFVNGKQRFGEITLEDLVVEGRSWGLKNAEEIAVATLRQIEEFVRAETPHPGAHPSLGSDIGMITRRLLDGSTAGTERGPRRARDNNAPGGWGGPVR